MAQVPYTPYATVEPEGVPARSHDVMDIHAPPEAFGSLTGQAAEKLGGTLEGAADKFMHVGLAYANLQNELWANDANTQAMQQLTQRYSEFSKLEGKAAVDAHPQFMSDIEGIYNQALGQSPNLYAKALLAKSMRYMVDSYGRYSTNYSDQQFRTWQDRSARDGAQAFGDQAALAINYPDRFNTLLNSGADQWRKLAEQRGLSADEQNAEVARWRGGTLTKIIGDVAKNGDVGRAEAIYAAYKDTVDPGSRLAMITTLRPFMAQERGAAIVSQAYASTKLTVTAPVTQQAASLSQAIETTGERGQVGQISPKGALGPMQLMPETAKAMAAKLNQPYDENQVRYNADYNRQLGSAYTSELLQKYSGNQTLTLAAYNAGPKAVDGWIKQFGDPTKGEISDADFAAKIPYKETRDYVARVNAVYPQQAGEPSNVVPLPGVTGPSRADAFSRVDELTRNEDPMVRAAAFADLEKRQKAQEAAYTDQERARTIYKQQVTDQSDKAEMDYRKGIIGGDANVSAFQIVNDPNLTREAQDRLIALSSGTGKAATQLSHKTAVDLINRMTLSEGDPNRVSDLSPIDKAYGQDKLTNPDYQFVVKRFTDGRTPDGQNLQKVEADFLKGVEKQIDKSNPLMGVEDQTGPTKMFLMRWDIDQKIAAYRKAGKDPMDLFNPAKPDFVGKPEALQPYITPLNESMQNILKRFGVAPAPAGAVQQGTPIPGGVSIPMPRALPLRKPDESPADYLKRISGL